MQGCISAMAGSNCVMMLAWDINRFYYVCLKTIPFLFGKSNCSPPPPTVPQTVQLFLRYNILSLSISCFAENVHLRWVIFVWSPYSQSRTDFMHAECIVCKIIKEPLLYEGLVFSRPTRTTGRINLFDDDVGDAFDAEDGSDAEGYRREISSCSISICF